MLNYDKITKELLINEYCVNRKSWRQIADELKVSDVLLLQYADKYGIKSRTVSESRLLINDLPKDEISELYANGMPISKLAIKYNVSYSVMRNFMKSSGIKLRSNNLSRSINKQNITPRWKWEQYKWLNRAYQISSINIIAKHTGWSYSRIRKSLIEFNIDLKDNKGPTNILNHILPEYHEVDFAEFENDIKNNNISYVMSKYGMLKTGIVDLCTDLKIKFDTVPIVRTGPSSDSLSNASIVKWQNQNFRDKVIQSNKDKFNDDEYAVHIANKRLTQRDNVSRPQQLLYDLLQSLNIKFIKESKETLRGFYSFDCMIEKYYKDYNLLIEVQGDYWHSLDRVRNNDRRKFNFLDKYYQNDHLIYVWEHEFNNVDNIKDRILSKLRLNATTDYSFDELIIKEVSYDEAKKILDAYHYLGAARGGIAYGAYLNDELVICVLFSSLIRQNISHKYNDAIEISRICVNPTYRKYNLVSWFISRAIDSIDYDTFIAYSDLTVGHFGSVYKALNFKLDHYVESDYWYIGQDNSILHKKTLYNRAIRNNMVESQYAEHHGYIKQYGGRKICFVYEK
jgi:hypothetical protein